MKTIMGVVRPTTGDGAVRGQADRTAVRPASGSRRGIAPVLEARRLFPRMTVFENLEMGAYTRRARPGVRRGSRAGLRAVPARQGAAQPARRHALGRRAADGGDRARADGAAAADLHGRAVDGPVAGSLSSRCSTSSRRSTGRARRSSWSSRTPPWRCRSPIAPMCCRPGRWCCRGTAAELRAERRIRQAYLGEMEIHKAA